MEFFYECCSVFNSGFFCFSIKGNKVKNSVCNLIIPSIITIAALFSFNCKEKIVGPNDKILYTTELKGNIILQNQSEYSNALVYLDSFESWSCH